MSKPGQPIHQSLQVSGTEQIRVLSGFSKQVQPQGIRAIDNFNFPNEPVAQGLSDMARGLSQPLNDRKTVNRFVSNRSNAFLPKAPTFDETDWKGFIHQFKLWCSA